MPVAMEPADAFIDMRIQWNDLPVQLGQLLDLHFCLVAPYILETSPEPHQVVERDDH